MDKKLIALFVGVFSFIFLVGTYTKKGNGPSVEFPGYKNKTVSINGKTIEVEVANTDAKRSKGLSGKNGLDDGKGMLFTFSSENVTPSFWMKDMKFAIDIIWIDDGKIVAIDKNVSPQPDAQDSELTFYRPGQPIDFVLEISAGKSDVHGFEIGSSIDLTKAL